MTKRKKIFWWSIIGLGSVALAVFLLGPVLFASIVYPLPHKHRPSIARWVPQYCQHVPDAHHLLSALIFAESSWREGARSSAGAVGLTQFMPSTASAVARRLGVSPFTPNDLFTDTDTAIRFGAYYLCTRISNYRGDINKALIAYNGGGGAVIAFERGTPFRGTIAYSNRVQSVARAYRAIYGDWWVGLDLTPVPPARRAPIPPREVPIGDPAAFAGPRVDLLNFSIIDFWQGLLFAQREPDSDGQLHNFWQDLL